ncbi:MAG: hypothetical protein ABSG92_10615 [Conexivisphaerales archaeon]
MSTRPRNRLDVEGFLNVAIMVSALVLASSLVLFVGTPARASELWNVDVSEITPHLFDPQGVTINVGDTVMWSDYHDAHTTTSYPGQAEYWDSGPMVETSTFSFTFTRTGNFTYYSEYPEDAGYVGWVFVQQPAPEFPGYLAYITVAAAVILALLLQRRLKA